MDIKMGNGSVTYENGTPGSAATTTTDGNVTIHNAAVEPTKGQYVVNFSLHFRDEDAPALLQNYVSLAVGLARPEGAHDYRDIEDQGAKRIPALLRNLAEAVEAENAAADARRAAQG